MSEKVTAMIEEIKGLTVLELSELVHALEEEFGVSAAAMAAPAAGGAAAAAAEEKTDFDVVLASFDAAAKIKVIKVVRESPAWASPRRRLLSRALPRPSRKASARTTPRP
jgi:large subunit ribosomal protein L7/L12